MQNHYPVQLTFREVVTVTLIGPAEGFLTVHERYQPSPGEIAAEEGRVVAWRCGDSPTTRTLPDGNGGSMVGIVYATLQSAEERARDRGVSAAMVDADAWLALQGLSRDSDDPDSTDMGELYGIVPLQ